MLHDLWFFVCLCLCAILFASMIQNKIDTKTREIANWHQMVSNDHCYYYCYYIHSINYLRLLNIVYIFTHKIHIVFLIFFSFRHIDCPENTHGEKQTKISLKKETERTSKQETSQAKHYFG